MVDVSKIKVGDRVAVWGEVTKIDRGETMFPIAVDGGWVSPEDILSHEPRGFQPGDRVRGKSTRRVGVIDFVKGEYVMWTPGHCDQPEVERAVWLERIDD
jgi:hypothetical protein